MAAIRIVLLGVFAAIVYGVAHDQVTARVCVEYFTIAHPPVFGTDNPTLLGVDWGILATWWVGLILGVGLAIAARAGGRPKRTPSSLVRPIAQLVIVMLVCAAIAGIAGYVAARSGAVYLVGWLAKEIPADRHARFLADAWAHVTSYIVGFVGGVALCILIWRARGKAEPLKSGSAQ